MKPSVLYDELNDDGPIERTSDVVARGVLEIVDDDFRAAAQRRAIMRLFTGPVRHMQLNFFRIIELVNQEGKVTLDEQDAGDELAMLVKRKKLIAGVKRTVWYEGARRTARDYRVEGAFEYSAVLERIPTRRGRVHVALRKVPKQRLAAVVRALKAHGGEIWLGDLLPELGMTYSAAWQVVTALERDGVLESSFRNRRRYFRLREAG